MTDTSTIPPDNQGGRRAQAWASGVLALLLLLAGLWTLRNFLRALVWAVILAIAIWPLFERLQHRVGGRWRMLAPALATLAVGLVLIAPLALVGFQLGHEAQGIADWLRSAEHDGVKPPDFLAQLPYGARAQDWWKQNLADPGAAGALLHGFNRGQLVDAGRDLGFQLVRRVTLLGITLLTLFFIFLEAPALTDQLKRAGRRAFGASGERLALQMIASVHGTVNGLVLVGLGEGLLMGIVYVLLGVPHATLLAAATAVAAMIPFAGPVAIGIAALLLLAQGSAISALVLALIGLAVGFIADHFVRPALIGGATKLPFLWVLLGILGGLEVWGLLGLFLGPAIMAALILLWREWAYTPAARPSAEEVAGADASH